jgi:hypothetical protein
VVSLPKNPRKNRQVGFEPWQAGLDKVNYSVPASRLSTLKVGEPAQIVTHAGALGWEWIEEVRELRSPPAQAGGFGLRLEVAVPAEAGQGSRLKPAEGEGLARPSGAGSPSTRKSPSCCS